MGKNDYLDDWRSDSDVVYSIMIGYRFLANDQSSSVRFRDWN